jgi:Cys-rich repeat protein
MESFGFVLIIVLALLIICIVSRKRREGFAAGPSPFCKTPARPFCSAGHACVTCLDAGDCAAGQQCSPDGQCVQCTDNSQCPGGFCRNNACTACDTDQDCVAKGAGKVCNVSDPDHHLCEACGQDSDCGPGHRCIGAQCVPTCTTAADCKGTTTPTCVQGLCVACTHDTDCQSWTPDTPHCAQGGLCVQCDTQGQCPMNPADPGQADLKVCVGSICMQCGGDSPAAADAYCAANYPSSPFCANVTGKSGPSQTCVQCRSGDHCINVPGKPHCLNGDCVGCIADPDCPSGQHCGTGNVCVSCDQTHGCAPGTLCSINGRCVQCEQEGDCATQAGGRIHCQTGTGACVVCRGDGDCPPGTHCTPDGSGCWPCVSFGQGDASCAAPAWLCSASSDKKGQCVECDADSDCRNTSKPYCIGHACLPPLCNGMVPSSSASPWALPPNAYAMLVPDGQGGYFKTFLYPAALHFGAPVRTTRGDGTSVTPVQDHLGYVSSQFGPNRSSFVSTTDGNKYAQVPASGIDYDIAKAAGSGGYTITYLTRDPRCSRIPQPTSSMADAMTYNSVPVCLLPQNINYPGVSGLGPSSGGSCPVAGSTLILPDRIPGI